MASAADVDEVARQIEGLFFFHSMASSLEKQHVVSVSVYNDMRDRPFGGMARMEKNIFRDLKEVSRSEKFRNLEKVIR